LLEGYSVREQVSVLLVLSLSPRGTRRSCPESWERLEGGGAIWVEFVDEQKTADWRTRARQAFPAEERARYKEAQIREQVDSQS
jgi:hypothetical protein